MAGFGWLWWSWCCWLVWWGWLGRWPFAGPDELVVLVPFGKDAYEAWLAVEDAVDVCWCHPGVEPCCCNGDAHKFC